MYMSTSIFSMYQWPHFGGLFNCCQCQFGFALSHTEFVFMLQSSSLCKQTIIQFLGHFPLLSSLSICSEQVPHICQIKSLPRSIANRLPYRHSQLLSHTPRHFSASLSPPPHREFHRQCSIHWAVAEVHIVSQSVKQIAR